MSGDPPRSAGPAEPQASRLADNLMYFARTLRAAGLPIGPGRVIDALKAVGHGINSIMRAPDKSVLLITHYQRLLDYVTPDKVHVLSRGRIVRSGGPELALELEREGYAEAEA